MLARGFKEILAEANAAVRTIDGAKAVARHQTGDAIFVDVRETQEWTKGHIPGAVHAPRGFLEFIADPEGPMHQPALSAGRPLILYCASGGRSALAAKTLLDMGITDVSHIAGGVQAWTMAGGKVEQ